jgi:hypothetical protein
VIYIEKAQFDIVEITLNLMTFEMLFVFVGFVTSTSVKAINGGFNPSSPVLAVDRKMF